MDWVELTIHDQDEQTTHHLRLPRPAANEPAIIYTVSFLTQSGKSVQHFMTIHPSTLQYKMTVKGRFVITA
jgi:hypothetical protein